MVLSYGLPPYPNLGKVLDALEYMKCLVLIQCMIFLQVEIFRKVTTEKNEGKAWGYVLVISNACDLNAWETRSSRARNWTLSKMTLYVTSLGVAVKWLSLYFKFAVFCVLFNV